MNDQHAYLVVAIAAATTLVAVSPVIGGANATPAVVTSAPDAAARGDATPEDGRTHSNSPHPAVLSFERPVYPIGVPNPPVSLEQY